MIRQNSFAWKTLHFPRRAYSRRLHQRRKAGIGIFPEGEEGFVFLPGGGVVAFHLQRARQTLMRKRNEGAAGEI